MAKFKRSISLLLLVAVLISAVPVAVYATTEETQTDRPVTAAPYALAESPRYYGRSALELLGNPALLYAYDQLAAGIEKTEGEISVYNGQTAITANDVALVMDAYGRDYAHHFWLGNRYGVSYDSKTVYTVAPQYLMTGSTLKKARKEFEAEVDLILAGITEDMTEYEKELYLHDTLAARIIYQESSNAHNAYGALVEGIAVCEGYAEAFQYLLHRVGIQSFIITGDAGGPHAWNMVCIDGTYYHVDLTWNDQKSDLYHSYFNVSDDVIKKDHAINATAYALPSCTSMDAHFFAGKDTYLTEYTVESIAQLLQNNDLKVHVYIPDGCDTFLSWYYSNIRQIAQKAGVYAGFGYGYSQMGNELVIGIYYQTVKVTDSTGIAFYNDISLALQRCAAGAQLRLLDDLTGSLNINQQIVLDLNGFDIAGNLTANTPVTVLDSQTADYTVANGNGYGVISGTVAGASPMTGYVTVTESSGTSYHKVDVAMKSLSLKAKAVGLYYTGSFFYDEVVAENLAAFGTVLSTENTMPVADDSDAGCLYTTTANSTVLKNIMSKENTATANRKNAKTVIYGRAYLKFSDGTYLYSDVCASNLQTMVETVDAQLWNKLSAGQKETLMAMYQAYREEMETWNIPNLKNA